MKRLVVLLALWPLVAVADQTVELKDGRKLLLREDGTYQFQNAASKGPRCKEPDKYLELDYRQSGSGPLASKIMQEKKPICMVVYVETSILDRAYYTFPVPKPKSGEKDTDGGGELRLSDLSLADQKWVADNCQGQRCLAAVYGEIVSSIANGHIIRVRATNIEG